MRKWKFAKVDFTPFQYNPVSKKLTLIESVVLELSYNQSPAELNERLMEDTSMDDTAAQISLNYEEAKGWYEYRTVTPKEGNDGSVSVTLNAGEYSIIKDENGLDVIQMEGFSSTDSAGDPMLVHNVYDVLVPPDAIGSSLQLEIVSAEISIIEGTYDIKPVGPALTWTDGKLTEDWGEGKVIVNGRNINVYGTNANYPRNYLELLPYSQMRKWKFAKVDFIPFQYNPVSKKLTLIESVVIKISYIQSPAKLDESLMADTVMDDIAPQVFLNYDEASDWYEPKLGTEPRATYDYVIITTNAIETSSTKLASFIAHKQSLGQTVLVVTEDDFGGLTGQAPNHKAEKIRQWLKNNYIPKGIKYVLLIGDPHPYLGGEGDIPMKMCWPMSTSSGGDTPTDYFYADLTGNWDKDGDGYYGEYNDDYKVSGGVDFSHEVYVGRIPVYSAAYTTLDNILQKIIDYETSGSVSWRKSILMPMPFVHPTGPYDGAMVGEQMRDDYLNANSYTSWRMYQQGNGACGLDSIYTSDQELRGGTVVRDRWAANDYGIVCWGGHGSPTSVIIGYSGCIDGTLFQSSYCSSLDDNHPAFTYQCSCTNGYPENSDNLQYAILKRGGIGTVAATRSSYFSTSVVYGMFDGSTTNRGIGYEYVKRLVQELPGGDALYQTKQSMTPSASAWLKNWYDFNLYGDPGVSLKKTQPVAPEDYGVFRNGVWYVDTTGNHHTNLCFVYGTAGDIPVVGDFSSCYLTSSTAPQPGVRVPAIAPGAEKIASPPFVSEEHGASGSKSTLTYEIPPVAAGDYEIKYDDGTAEDSWTVTDYGLGCILTVCFTPPEYPVTVKKARLFIDDYGTPSTPIKIHVYEQATGSSAPGTELITPFIVTPPGPGWYDVDLRGYNIVINSGSFAIGEEPTQSYSVYLGEDQSGSIDKRSWWYSVNSHTWLNWVDDKGHTGDFMIRAIVETGGDGELDDYGVFRNGIWYVDTDGDHITNMCFVYGTTGDRPVVGDVNRDGHDDTAVFRNGVWYVDTTGNHYTNMCFVYGTTGDRPVVGDVNRDGHDDTAVFRNGVWYVDTTGNHYTNMCFVYGAAGDRPVVGDFNQDGNDDTAVFRNGVWYVDTTGNHYTNMCFVYGTAGDIPIVGNIG
jgi:hypothetical protein